MTSVRQTLQSALFGPLDERLIGALHVVNAKKPKKTYILCIAVTTSTPIAARLHQVKALESSSSSTPPSYVKKTTWRLRDVRLVNGINPRKVLPEFELVFDDKTFYWLAVEPNEKDAFIKQLWRTSGRYLTVQKPEFVNVSIPVEHLEAMSTLTTAAGVGDTDSSSSQLMDVVGGDRRTSADDYAPMTPREEADFRRLLAQCQLTVGEADNFHASLMTQLGVLDTHNMHSIMGAEASVVELMHVIDKALEHVDVLDGRLGELDATLANVRDNVDMMEEKESVAHIEHANRVQLGAHMKSFLATIDYLAEDERRLTEAHLSDVQSIQRCTRAAQNLRACLVAECPSGMQRMDCYAQQMDKLRALADSFSDKLLAHLSTFFQRMNEQTDEVGDWHALSLPKHSQIHRPLLPFAELVMFVKKMRPPVYEEIIKRYVEYTSAMYKTDVEALFETVYAKLGRIGEGGSSSTLTRRTSIVDTNLLDETLDSGAHVKLTNLCQTLFSEIDLVLVAEQKFCVRFLHITQEMPDDGTSLGSADMADKRAERQYNEHVRMVMSRLFGHLDVQLNNFVDHIYSVVNRSLIMWLLVVLTERALALADKSSYLAVILGTMAVLAKRRFDNFMEWQRSMMLDYRATKRTRFGILDANAHFASLARAAQLAFAGEGTRRTDVDRWMPQMLIAVRQAIERAANDANSKAPADVVRFENYHALHSTLCEQKIVCLDAKRPEIKRLYQTAMAAYIHEYMGKPLGKLHTFFENIERMIGKGIAAEEISYQQQFNKTELRKVIGTYPPKEVKRELEQLYKRVQTKHLTDGADSPLLQVVWRNMQEDFLSQLKTYSSLMAQCYAGSNIELEFTINDVLRMFSDIAMQQ